MLQSMRINSKVELENDLDSYIKIRRHYIFPDYVPAQAFAGLGYWITHGYNGRLAGHFNGNI